MNRIIVSTLATTLLCAGVWLLTRKPADLRSDGQMAAGVAYVEQPDGSFKKSTGVRSAERTIVVPRKSASGSAAPSAEKGAEWLTDFTLTERSGKEISSRSFRGQPYVVGFFFATCPSICVRQNEKFKILQDKFQGQPIRLVEITCDPEVDRPEVLAEYANRFDADPDQWLFFTGDLEYIQRVGSEMYSIGIMRRGHPEKFALIDAEGKVYGLYTWSDAGQWQALQKDMAKLIAELPK